MEGTAMAREESGGRLGLWAFRFLLWYVCIMLVQPQNRFTFLWPLRIANITFIVAAGLHVLSCIQDRRPWFRLGPATLLAMSLIFFSLVSTYFAPNQITREWSFRNVWIEWIVKNALLLILLEAMLTSVKRVWAVQMVLLIATLWWLKSGVRLSAAGATYSASRLMGAAVGLIDNPNSFAYMLCLFLPLYLYTHQQARTWWGRYFFLALSLVGVYIILQTGSRTGLLTLLGIAVFLLPRYVRHHRVGLLLIAVVVVFIVSTTAEQNIRRFQTIPRSITQVFRREPPVRTRLLTQDEQSARDRRKRNVQTWKLIKRNFLFGVGLAPDPWAYGEEFRMAIGEMVHCEILMAGRQMGCIGMGLYVGFLLVILVEGWQIQRQAAGWSAVADLGWTFKIQALALMIGGTFCPMPWHPPMMIFAASASALSRLLREPGTIPPWVYRLAPHEGVGGG